MKLCSVCGKENDEDALFCTYCGNTLEKAASEEMPGASGNPFEAWLSDEKERPLRKRRKHRAAAIAAIAGILLLAGLIGAGLCMILKGQNKIENCEYGGKQLFKKADHSAVYVSVSGEVLSFNRNVKEGWVTPDAAHFVIIDEAGQLYIYDAEGKNEKKAASGADSMLHMTENGFIYMAEDEETLMRYKFGEKAPDIIGKGEYFAKEGRLDMLLCSRDGIFIYPERDQAPVKLSSTTSDRMLALSIDAFGQSAIWCLIQDDRTEYYIYEDGKESLLGTVDTAMRYDDGYAWADFINGGSRAVVFDTEGSTVLIKEKGEAPKAAGVKGFISPVSAELYEKAGRLGKDCAFIGGGYHGTYAVTYQYDTDTHELWYIDEDGKSSQVLSEAYEICDIWDGRVFYIDENRALYTGKLSGGSLGETIKIASGVQWGSVDNSGTVFYYEKPYGSGGDIALYAADLKDGQLLGRQIDSRIGNYTETDKPGRFIYLKNVRPVEDSGLSEDTDVFYGGLYIKDESGAQKRLDSKVINVYRETGKAYMDADSFFYFKYKTVDQDGNIVGDLLYYDGRTSKTFAEDIVYP